MRALIAGFGIVTSQLVEVLPSNSSDLSEVVKIVVQILIGIVSIFHIIKNKKNEQ